eukprot:m.36025 g.36025  ORF g.36025 m.36025 type:complete len:64 (+) comp12826_c0_seq1:1886-2077(+)
MPMMMQEAALRRLEANSHEATCETPVHISGTFAVTVCLVNGAIPGSARNVCLYQFGDSDVGLI